MSPSDKFRPDLPLRPRIKKKLEKAMRKAGLHIVPDPVKEALFNVVEEELLLLRTRIAGVIEVIASRYEAVSPERMESLALIVLRHYSGDNNEVELPDDMLSDTARLVEGHQEDDD